MIRAVIFDLGGVYFTNGTTLAIRKFSKVLGVPEKKLLQLFNPMDGYALEYRTGRMSRDDFWGNVTRALNVKYSDYEKLENIWKNSYRPLVGMQSIVNQVRKRYKVALLSGNVPEVAEYMKKKYRLSKHFDVCVFSFEVGFNKNHPKMFNDVLKKLNVRADECLFIDDKKTYTETARKLGIRTVKFSSVRELKKRLRQIGVL